MADQDSVKIIGKAIKEGRKRRGWSQKDLATFMNVHTTLVSKWETFRSVPTGEGLFKLAIELDIIPVLFSDYFAQRAPADPLMLKREIDRLTRENLEIKDRLNRVEEKILA